MVDHGQELTKLISSLIQFLYFTASAGVWDNQLFPIPQPLCLPEGIYSPFSAVLYNVNDINGKTDSLCSKSK